MQHKLQTLAQRIASQCEDTMGGVVTLVANYSGRGMYGKTCVGITGTNADCMHLIGQVIKTIGADVSATALVAGIDRTDQTTYDLAEVEEVFDESIDTLLGFSQDSMGHNVILYWPTLKQA